MNNGPSNKMRKNDLLLKSIFITEVIPSIAFIQHWKESAKYNF